MYLALEGAINFCSTPFDNHPNPLSCIILYKIYGVQVYAPFLPVYHYGNFKRLNLPQANLQDISATHVVKKSTIIYTYIYIYIKYRFVFALQAFRFTLDNYVLPECVLYFKLVR